MTDQSENTLGSCSSALPAGAASSPLAQTAESGKPHCQLAGSSQRQREGKWQHLFCSRRRETAAEKEGEHLTGPVHSATGHFAHVLEGLSQCSRCCVFLLNQLSSLPSPRLQALDEPTDRLLRWTAAHDLSALDVAQLVS